VIITIVVVIKL